MAEQEKERNFTRYEKNGNIYEPIGVTKKILPSGFYKPVWDRYNGRYFFASKEVVMPKLYVLPSDIQLSILDDIKRFWKSEERYRQFGQVYKRNILLYSLPGNGKTSLINIICKILIEDYDGVVICIDTTDDLNSYGSCMDRLRSIEPNRKVITLIEDFERLAKDDYYSAMLLQLLDGNAQFDNVVTIATTNYPQILEKRFTCRPSRFNLVIEYKKPTAEIRKAYITNKLSDGGIDVNDETVKKDIDRYVAKTEGYTFDFLKEVIQGIYVDGFTEVEIFDRLEELIKKDGQVKITEDSGKKIGFNSGATECNKDAEECEATEAAPHPVIVKQRNVDKARKGVVKGFG
jgi:SpoVK/Ycf46/Vps4 family AAA+-type ATPase